MNLFLNTLEKTFDDYFHTITDLTPDNPKYIEEYRKELNNFCQFLVHDYKEAQNTVTFWTERFED